MQLINVLWHSKGANLSRWWGNLNGMCELKLIMTLWGKNKKNEQLIENVKVEFEFAIRVGDIRVGGISFLIGCVDAFP